MPDPTTNDPPAPEPSPSQPTAESSPPQPTDHAENAEPGIKSRTWISRQAPDHYTLQLSSTLDQEALIRFIRKHGIEEHAAYYATIQKGKTWYSLIYGDYTQRHAAHQAMRKLPRSLRRNSPRIRSFQEIQAQLAPAP